MGSYRRWFFGLILLLYSPLFATNIPGSITLLNDSPFVLTATVYTHSGLYLGQLTLQPGQQKNFTTNLNYTNINRPGNSDLSITPYRIVWQCPGGEIYSMARDGSVGSFVRASECPGNLMCTPKKEGDKAQPPPPGPPNK